jgi:hypothetical protein
VRGANKLGDLRGLWWSLDTRAAMLQRNAEKKLFGSLRFSISRVNIQSKLHIRHEIFSQFSQN